MIQMKLTNALQEVNEKIKCMEKSFLFISLYKEEQNHEYKDKQNSKNLHRNLHF